MSLPTFEAALHKYLSALDRRGSDATHDYRRSIFIEFLRDAFDIQADEIPLEERLKVAEVRGFIDALYKAIIFEFKKDLKREREDGKAELRRYFTARPQSALALLTEGYQFEVYAPEAGDVRLIDSVDLRRIDVAAAHRFFDVYLFAEKQVVPDSADVVARFGAKSPTYDRIATLLSGLWSQSESDPTARVKFDEWNRLLAKVYGSAIGNDDLFLRHTYLSLLAKTFAYAALFPDAAQQGADLKGIVSGTAFAEQGYSNLAEEDFFTWVLHPAVRSESLEIVGTLLGRLAIYDLSAVNEDLLKELYQNLIDPDDRHDLGEYYTPDWLAEWTLREAGFVEALEQGQPSALDPSSGSGTFIFAALRLARLSGLKGAALVRYAIGNVLGMDVHPLAVTISKVNFVLALADDLKQWHGGELRLPIYIADSIQRTLDTGAGGLISIPTGARQQVVKGRQKVLAEQFVIPEGLARDRGRLEAILDAMSDAARQPGDAAANASAFWNAVVKQNVPPEQKPYWMGNCKLLTKLVRENRDTIWAFILKNCFQPAYITGHKVDFIVGNPPWLAYNFIKHADYQDQVRKWTLTYDLLIPGDTKLFTKLDLSTLFFEHCREQFLETGGTLAMVMPRSVITGAKQHARFRGRGFTKILDVREVMHCDAEGRMRSVFNVPSCVLIATGDQRPTADIPCLIAAGSLPARNLSWDNARPHLKIKGSTYTPPASESSGSPYYADFKQGAIIAPRCLWFVQSAAQTKRGLVNRTKPALETDPDTDHDGKVPWKGKRISGAVESDFLYATMLGDNLVPFGTRAFDLVVLPIVPNQSGVDVLDKQAARREGFPGLADWLGKVEIM